jgi:hypothetical protein
MATRGVGSKPLESSKSWLLSLRSAAKTCALTALAALNQPGCHEPVAPAPKLVVARSPVPAGPRAVAPSEALPVTSRLADESYRCTLVIGPEVATSWFEAGFEELVPNERWEALSTPRAFLEALIDPGAHAWSTPVHSPCADRSESPERVLFFAVAETAKDQNDWITSVTAAVNAVRARYPSARKIQLFGSVRAPAACAPPAAALAHTAIRRVAQQFDQLVEQGPELPLDNCELFEPGGVALTPAGRASAAKLVASHYLNDS